MKNISKFADNDAKTHALLFCDALPELDSYYTVRTFCTVSPPTTSRLADLVKSVVPFHCSHFAKS